MSTRIRFLEPGKVSAFRLPRLNCGAPGDHQSSTPPPSTNTCRKCHRAFISVFPERTLCGDCQLKRERVIEFFERAVWALVWIAAAVAAVWAASRLKAKG